MRASAGIEWVYTRKRTAQIRCRSISPCHAWYHVLQRRESQGQGQNLYCGLTKNRNSKVTDIYPGVTDVYRNGLLHVISRGSPLARLFTLLANDSSSAGLYCKLEDWIFANLYCNFVMKQRHLNTPNTSRWATSSKCPSSPNSAAAAPCPAAGLASSIPGAHPARLCGSRLLCSTPVRGPLQTRVFRKFSASFRPCVPEASR